MRGYFPVRMEPALLTSIYISLWSAYWGLQRKGKRLDPMEESNRRHRQITMTDLEHVAALELHRSR